MPTGQKNVDWDVNLQYKQDFVMHYENLPMQYIETFLPVKIENFIKKISIFFLFLLKT